MQTPATQTTFEQVSLAQSALVIQESASACSKAFPSLGKVGWQELHPLKGEPSAAPRDANSAIPIIRRRSENLFIVMIGSYEEHG